jgi:hypothetical protein
MGVSVPLQSGRFWWARYGLSTILCLVAIGGIYFGGSALALSVLVIIGVGFVLDDLIGDEHETASRPPSLFCNVNLYLAAPLLVALSGVYMAAVARVETWQFGSLCQVAVTSVLVGYLYALLGATVGHELVHRTRNPAASVCANILLAFTFNTSFVVFHLTGHHRYVATLRDPASARRGETWLAFFVRTVRDQTLMAFDAEAARLRRQNRHWLSWQNRILQGQAYTIVILAAACGLAGLKGMLALLASAVIGRFAHELINYIQHYGLVRLDGHPVEERHTWDCKRLISNALQYNLPRHADHHLHADRLFWQLTTTTAAPTLPYGYQTMAMIALVPTLWRGLMRPLLSEWDQEKASASERKIIAERGWDKLC